MNPKKTRVQRPETRDVVRRVRTIQHRAKAEGLAAQKREQHPNFCRRVEGMIAYISMVKPDVGAKLRSALDELKVD